MINAFPPMHPNSGQEGTSGLEIPLNVMQEAADRMQEGLHARGITSFAQLLAKANLAPPQIRALNIMSTASFPDVWLLSREALEAVFPLAAYHVTTGLAAVDLLRGGSVVPTLASLVPAESLPFHHAPLTGGGIWKQIQRPFLEEFASLPNERFDLAAFVFAGTKPNPEMVAFQDRLRTIYPTIGAYDAAVLALLTNGDGGPSAVVSEILQVPQGSNNRSAAVAIFCQQLYGLTHLREGWLETIKNSFLKLTPQKYDTFLRSLTDIIGGYNEVRWLDSIGGVSDRVMPIPVVVQLDATLAMKLMFGDDTAAVYPVLVGTDRPMGTITPLLRIPPACVAAIYGFTRPGYNKRGQLRLAPFPNESAFWLGGVPPDKVGIGYNAPPVCELAYTGTSTNAQTWVDLVCAGLIAPVYDFCPTTTTGMSGNGAEFEGKDGRRNGADKATRIFGLDCHFSGAHSIRGVFDYTKE